MTKKSVVFFGSFLHYSTKIAQKLLAHPFIDLVAVVTTPPAPAGGKKVLKNTHSYEWAKENNIAVFTPDDLFSTPSNQVLGSIKKPDYFVVAGYGKLLPKDWISYPTIGSVNLHFSLLPDYKGSNPAEWAILLGETETGVTMITLDEKFDTGRIITRKTYPLSDDDTRETVYEPLYDLASDMATETLPFLESLDFADEQELSTKPDALRFIRAYGFIDWQFIKNALDGHEVKDPLPLLSKNLKTAWEYLNMHPSESEGLITPEVFVERAVRALSGFPGVWTYLPTKSGKKRMKILSTVLEEGILTLDQVQIEGKNPAKFHEIKNQIAND